MNLINIVLYVVQAALACFLALFPLHQAAAQDGGNAKSKAMHIWVLTEKEGQLQVLDTTLQVTDETSGLQVIKALPIAAAAATQLKIDLQDVLQQDATKFNTILLEMDGLRRQATALGKLRAFQLDSTLNGASREALLQQLKELYTDSSKLPGLKRMTYQFRTDGADIIYKQDATAAVSFPDSAFAALEANLPRLLRQVAGDTSEAVQLRQKFFSHLKPAQAQRIIVLRNGSDSMRIKPAAPLRLFIERDSATQRQRIYRIEQDGSVQELPREAMKLDHANSSYRIVLLQAQVKDLTPADKMALEEIGADVETKAKEKLGVEEISFYPNPNNGQFQLNFRLENTGTTRVSVMDSHGEEVFVDTVEQLSGPYNRQLDLTPFGPGIYYLQIAQGKRFLTKKILVQ